MLVAITCSTHERYRAFDICQRLMKQQTRQPDMWVTAGDFGPIGSTHHIFRPRDTAGHTMCRNLIAALSVIPQREDVKVVIFEDDDWYHASWLSTCNAWLDDYSLDIFGEAYSLYYNVKRRQYAAMNNKDHASLCSTAFRGSLIPDVIRLALDDKPYGLDISLWQLAVRRRLKTLLRAPKVCENRVVGIKGLPGTPDRELRGATSDPDCRMLDSMIGSGWTSVYSEFGAAK